MPTKMWTKLPAKYPPTKPQQNVHKTATNVHEDKGYEIPSSPTGSSRECSTPIPLSLVQDSGNGNRRLTLRKVFVRNSLEASIELGG